LAALDTDILVALLKGNPNAVKKIESLQEDGHQISTTMITAYELAKGAYLSSRADENLVKVDETLSSMRILDLSFGAADQAAKIYKEVRDKGKMIGEFDILIAAIVKFNDETLVTRDRHFESIHGIKLINW
jgi:predicted nucleic acid-binding protein